MGNSQRRLVTGFWLLACALAALARPTAAIEVKIKFWHDRHTAINDPQYDATRFFDPTTANGALARATIEAAAQFYSNLIDDTLAAIPHYDPLTPGTQNTPVWRQVITNPTTGQNNYAISSAANASEDGLTSIQGTAHEFTTSSPGISIPANEFWIYVGASNIGTSGLGGTGVGFFGSQSFNDLIDQRGKPAGEYSTWGGYTIFDNATTWQLDSTQSIVGAGKIDLYSVALHEIGHVLGLNGNSSEWNQFQVGAEWRGAQSLAAWLAEDPTAPENATGIPTESTIDHHWDDHPVGQNFVPTVRSYVLGTRLLQESAMDPTITVGTRKLITNVDAYALRDIGWNIPNSAFDVSTLAADFDADGIVDGDDNGILRQWFGVALPASGDANFDGAVDGADALIWQQQLGMTAAVPLAGTVAEPSAFSLAAILAAAAARRRARVAA